MMLKYRAKTPWWLKLIFPKKLVWEMPTGDEPAVYITFDDGPHPVATPFVLDLLDKYEANLINMKPYILPWTVKGLLPSMALGKPLKI